MSPLALSLALWLCGQAPPAPVGAPPPAAAAPAPPPPPPVVVVKPGPPPPPPVAPSRLHGAFEAGFTVFPSGSAEGGADVFGVVTPILGYDVGEDFGMEFGAPFLLRLIDTVPLQRDTDVGGVLRRQDWDERSDYGQLIRELRLFPDGARFSIRAGPVETFTLGAGHVVHRYNNRGNPNYHPASADVRAYVGPTRTELFASDLLGARLFAGELMVDVGRVLGVAERNYDRFHVGLTGAHDFGEAGGKAPSLSVMHLDMDAGLVRSPDAQAFLVAGLGTRVGQGPSPGALIGLSAEGRPGGFQVGGRLEARKQAGSFRHNFFGPQYELSRFAGVGERGLPIAEEALPDGWSVYGEFALAVGPELPARGIPRIYLTLGGEYFGFGRAELDVELAVRAMDDRLALFARVTGVGLGVTPRFGVSLSGRYRFAPSLYAVASGGTVDFPLPDATLARGVYASLGVGADFER